MMLSNKYWHIDAVFFSVLILLGIMACNVFFYQEVPWGDFRGLDFHNLHTFHNCTYANHPYFVEGKLCKDGFNRPIYYPPLFYWSYFWTRGLEHLTGYYILIAQTTVAMLAVYFFIWNSFSKKSEIPLKSIVFFKAAVFWLLLLGASPFMLSIERGNTDPLVVILFIAAFVFFENKQYFLFGFFGLFASLYKLYPFVSCLIVGGGFIFSNYFINKSSEVRPLMMCSMGILFCLILVVLPLVDQHVIYFSKILPIYVSTYHPGIDVFSHALSGLQGIYWGLSWVVKIGLVFSWAVFSSFKIQKDPPLVFTGVLAISTFFGNVSFDYNLVTVFPLFLVLFLRCKKVYEVIYLFFGLLLFIGSREFWLMISTNEARIFLEAFWLICLPIICFKKIYSPVIN